MQAVRRVANKLTTSQIYNASSSISSTPRSQTYSTEANSSLKSSPQDKQVVSISIIVSSVMGLVLIKIQKSTTKPAEETPKVHKKTQAELDKELELKMQGLAGDGGESGVELEDGQPTAMKRSVRNNMFRYI
jgi:hypothetical protein